MLIDTLSQTGSLIRTPFMQYLCSLAECRSSIRHGTGWWRIGGGRKGRGNMFGIHELWLFVISGLLLNITPGPDTAYIVGRSIQLGWRGGVVAALGIGAGCLIHVFAAAIGLSALLVASSVAFTLVKWVGA